MIYKMKNVPLNLQSTFNDTLFDPFKYLLSVKSFVHVALLAKRLTAESSAALSAWQETFKPMFCLFYVAGEREHRQGCLLGFSREWSPRSAGPRGSFHSPIRLVHSDDRRRYRGNTHLLGPRSSGGYTLLQSLQSLVTSATCKEMDMCE